MSHRILVVDDEPIVSEVVERYLGLYGYDVKTSDDGRTALEVAREGALTWWCSTSCPVVDGREVCRSS